MSTRTDTRFPYTSLLRSPSRGDPRRDAAALLVPRADEFRPPAGPLSAPSTAGLCRGNSMTRPVRLTVDHLPHVIGLHRSVAADRSEEHTSELQSLLRISYAVFCLNKKT